MSSLDKKLSSTNWTVDDSRHHYNLPNWSEDFFDLAPNGEVVVRPDPSKPHLTFPITEICNRLKKKGMQMPALLRFVDILRHRVKSLCEAFNQSINSKGYRGSYTVCYPIKVNQQRRVVEGLLSTNESLTNKQVGLEAGSKPELMAVLGMAEKTNSTIVCNGYKDLEYIRSALIASELGHRIFIVVEKVSELNLVLKASKDMGIKPCIGVRARLSSKGESKWQDSGGDHSKFGLSAGQILNLVDKLEKEQLIDSFQLIHFHLGSQITSINDIQNALKECARFYAELHKLGVNLEYVDVGGGLGVDYEGTRSMSHCSVNYSLSEYANNVVDAFSEISLQNDIPEPNIITESGRALTAHHAVLIANVIDSEKMEKSTRVLNKDTDNPILNSLKNAHDEAASLIKNTPYSDEQFNYTLLEHFHTAEHCLKQVQDMFSYGMVDLSERATAEGLHKNILFMLFENLIPNSQNDIELLASLEKRLSSKFFVNFSIFQSLPDSWAIDQIFPLLPLENLNHAPTETAILQDITCDSDGMLKHYVNNHQITSTIDLPPFELGKEYLLGLFMVGAYQEILGDMHNLFGDSHTITLEIDENDELVIRSSTSGNTVEELLDYVDFSSKNLLESYKRQLQSADLEQSKQRQYLAELRQGIYGYCYLEEQ